MTIGIPHEDIPQEQESLLRSQLQNRLYHNIRRLPIDLQAQMAKKLRTADPEKVKEVQLRRRIKQIMESTDMDQKALESMRAVTKLNEKTLYGSIQGKGKRSPTVSPEPVKTYKLLNSTTMTETAGQRHTYWDELRARR